MIVSFLAHALDPVRMRSRFNPWKPLFGGYMPLSLLVSYRRDRGELLMTVLLEMLVTERFSLEEIEGARAELPSDMPPAYAALPESLDVIVTSARAAHRKMVALGLSRPRTGDEAEGVLNLALEVVQDVTQAPVNVSWRFPPHLTPQGGAFIPSTPLSADSPVVELEAGEAEDDDWSDILPRDLDDESLTDAVSAALSEPIDPTELQDTGSFPLPETSRHRAWRPEDGSLQAGQGSPSQQNTPPRADAPRGQVAPPPPSPIPPHQGPTSPRRAQASKVVDPFMGLPRMAPPPAEFDDDDEDEYGTEIITQIITPADLAARIEEADRKEARAEPGLTQVELGGVQGFEIGTPSLGGSLPSDSLSDGNQEESLDLDPETGDIGDLLGEASADGFSPPEDKRAPDAPPQGSADRFDGFLTFLEEGLYIDPREPSGLKELETFTQRVRGELDGLGAQLSLLRVGGGQEILVEGEALLRGVEALISVQERTHRALSVSTGSAPPPPTPAPKVEASLPLQKVLEALSRLKEGRRLSRRQLMSELGGKSPLVDALYGLSRQVDQWKEGADVADEALRRLEGLHGKGSSGAKVLALEEENDGLRFQIATWEQEAQQLRVLAAWGNLRALVAEVKEEIVSLQAPGELSGHERGEVQAQLFEKWADVQRYLGVLHNKLPRETMAPVVIQVEALSAYFKGGRPREPFSWP